MKTILICALFLFFFTSVFAQYPFEKYPAIKYKKVAFYNIQSDENSPRVRAAIYKNYRVELFEAPLEDKTNVLIYLNGKIIKRVNVTFGIDFIGPIDPLCISDIDGDGSFDLKISFRNDGSGLAGSLVGNLFLFQVKKNVFKKVFFADFYGESKPERDLNGDGKYEIFAQNYLSYKNHSYWVFDVFNFKNGELLNVSYRYNFPILTRFLATKISYGIVKNIPRTKSRSFSRKTPEFYEQDK